MRRQLAVAIALLAISCGPAAQPGDSEDTVFSSLQRGEATVRCRDGDEYPRRTLSDITFTGIHNTLVDCDLSELVLFYEGEIDPSFAQLISAISERHWPYRRRALFIHSTGGDVEAALTTGELISREPWSVFVARAGETLLAHPHSTAKCYSACVFVLAAGRERHVLGEVGIHRMYPSGSEASTRAQLDEELTSITDRAKQFMRLNGVNVALVDEMMSVPSSDIRVLTVDQLEAYGLGAENAAQSDLERLDLERRCGERFVARLRSARAEVDAVCAPELRASCARGADACVAASPAMDACSNNVNRTYGFPDPSCPEDGPYFYCADGSISKNCEDQN